MSLRLGKVVKIVKYRGGKMKNLDAQIIADPRVFEVGTPNKHAKKIMRESKGKEYLEVVRIKA